MPITDAQVTNLLSSSAGRVSLGQAMLSALNIDSVPRRVLRVMLLADDEPPTFNVINNRKVTVQEFDLTTRVGFSTNFDENGNILGLNKIVAKASKKLTELENDQLFSLIRTSKKESGMYAMYYATGGLIGESKFKNAVYQSIKSIDAKGLKPKTIITNNREFNTGDIYFGLNVIKCEQCKENEIFILPNIEQTGIMAIRREPSCVPVEDPSAFMNGNINFTFFELIGMAITAIDNVGFVEYTLPGKYKNKYHFISKV